MYLSKIPYPLRLLYPKNVIWNFDLYTPLLYLTFDDGPNPETTSFILDVLDKHNIKATFFCKGSNVEKYPGLFQDILKSGHDIGNHTYSHPRGTGTSFEVYLEDFQRFESIHKTKLFRPPYGRMTCHQAKEIEKTHKIIIWTVLAGDFDLKRTPEKCLQVVKKYSGNGSVIVFHDSDKAKERLIFALPRFIEYAVERGYGFEKIISNDL